MSNWIGKLRPVTPPQVFRSWKLTSSFSTVTVDRDKLERWKRHRCVKADDTDRLICNITFSGQVMTLTLAQFFNPLPHMLFLHPRTHMGGGGPPCHSASNWDRAAGQKVNESLGCFEINGTRVDVLRSYIDPSRSGQRKKYSNFDIYGFSPIFFELRKITASFKHHRVSLFETTFLPRMVKLKIWPQVKVTRWLT